MTHAGEGTSTRSWGQLNGPSCGDCTQIAAQRRYSPEPRYGILRVGLGMFGFDRVVGSNVARRGARGLVKTGKKVAGTEPALLAA